MTPIAMEIYFHGPPIMGPSTASVDLYPYSGSPPSPKSVLHRKCGKQTGLYEKRRTTHQWSQLLKASTKWKEGHWKKKIISRLTAHMTEIPETTCECTQDCMCTKSKTDVTFDTDNRTVGIDNR